MKTPHRDTDWAPMLDEIVGVYVEMAREIAKREPLLIVLPDKNELPQEIREMTNVTIVECPTNDTWARDHGFITLVADDSQDAVNPNALFLDFCFNGWGLFPYTVMDMNRYRVKINLFFIFLEDQEQTHRVCTTGQSLDDRVSRIYEIIFSDVICNFLIYAVLFHGIYYIRLLLL